MAASVRPARVAASGAARDGLTTALNVPTNGCVPAYVRDHAAAWSTPGLHRGVAPGTRRCVALCVPAAVTAGQCADVEACTARARRAAVSTARRALCHRCMRRAMLHQLRMCARACARAVWRGPVRAVLRATMQARVNEGRLPDLHFATRKGRPDCALAAIRGRRHRTTKTAQEHPHRRRLPHHVAGPSLSAGEHRDRPHASAC